MGFQDTINEIFKGLTGDNKADIQSLNFFQMKLKLNLIR